MRQTLTIHSPLLPCGNGHRGLREPRAHLITICSRVWEQCGPPTVVLFLRDRKSPTPLLFKPGEHNIQSAGANQCLQNQSQEEAQSLQAVEVSMVG